jgi:hypothetical protein
LLLVVPILTPIGVCSEALARMFVRIALSSFHLFGSC